MGTPVASEKIVRNNHVVLSIAIGGEMLGYAIKLLTQPTNLQNTLLKNPESGDVIEGTGGLRKMRYADTRRGKGTSAAV